MNNIGLITAVVNVGRRIARFARRVWNDHLELLDSNPIYRSRLEAGAIAILGACSMHPTAALVATVALSIYIAAHETGGPSTWRPGFGGPTIRRPDDPDWEF